jgi:hypothetical protein
LEYRAWLAQTMGISKVVSGCEKLIMREIEKKLDYFNERNIRNTERNTRTS